MTSPSPFRLRATCYRGIYVEASRLSASEWTLRVGRDHLIRGRWRRQRCSRSLFELAEGVHDVCAVLFGGIPTQSSLESIFALCVPTSAFTVSMWPFSAAYINAVLPCSSSRPTCAPGDHSDGYALTLSGQQGTHRCTAANRVRKGARLPITGSLQERGVPREGHILRKSQDHTTFDLRWGPGGEKGCVAKG